MGKKFESHILIRFPIYFALNAGMLKLFEGHIFTRLYCGLFILLSAEIDRLKIWRASSSKLFFGNDMFCMPGITYNIRCSCYRHKVSIGLQCSNIILLLTILLLSSLSPV